MISSTSGLECDNDVSQRKQLAFLVNYVKHIPVWGKGEKNDFRFP